jgi:VanZ family protein
VILITIEFLATATVGAESVTLGWDKLNHIAAFMVLYTLVSLAFEDLNIVYRFLLLFAFGLQIELVQSFLPPREFSYLDISADTVGIMFGFLISPYAVKFFRYK